MQGLILMPSESSYSWLSSAKYLACDFQIGHVASKNQLQQKKPEDKSVGSAPKAEETVPVVSDQQAAKPEEPTEVEQEVAKLKQEMGYIFQQGKYQKEVIGAALLESLFELVRESSSNMDNEGRTMMKVGIERYIHGVMYPACGMEYLG